MRRSTLAALLGPSLLLAACGHVVPPAALPHGAGNPVADALPGRVVVHWRDAAARTRVCKQLGLDASTPLDPASDEAVSLPSNLDLDGFRRAAGSDAAWVEPDYRMHLPAVQADEPDPTDAVERARASGTGHAQYALRLVNALDAWHVTRGHADVKIAIVDSGVDADHPDLDGQVVESAGLLGLGGRLGVGSARDDNGHGTHCAGIAAATGRQGVSGLAPGCKLLVAKVLDRHGEGDTADIARGVNWSVDHGAAVISLSVGGEENARVLRDAIARALDHGVVVVAAMGNEGRAQRNFPAAYPGVIAVGATNANDRVANYSTRGPWISVCAPGTSILSTTPTYGCTLNSASEGALTRVYGKLSGTSMATPLVAGLAGLVRSAHPDWSPAQVKSAIEHGAKALGDGPDDRAGHGRIDAAATLQL